MFPEFAHPLLSYPILLLSLLHFLLQCRSCPVVDGGNHGSETALQGNSVRETTRPRSTGGQARRNGRNHFPQMIYGLCHPLIIRSSSPHPVLFTSFSATRSDHQPFIIAQDFHDYPHTLERYPYTLDSRSKAARLSEHCNTRALLPGTSIRTD